MNQEPPFRSVTQLVRGVPSAGEPLYWDNRLSHLANIHTVEKYLRDNAEHLPFGCTFDEVAIMAPNPAARDLLVKELVLAGWKVFNQAKDLVYTNPLGTRYVVGYTFLSHSGKPYRMEVMLLGQPAQDGTVGFSPLHQSLWQPDGRAPTWADHAEMPIPHLSFKPTAKLVRTIGARRAVRRVLDTMTKEGFIIAQACQSTYGEFWYLKHVDQPRALYLKPRINQRDDNP